MIPDCDWKDYFSLSMLFSVLFDSRGLVWSYNALFQVTGVGLNTEWGVLMANISEDNAEETPLQVWRLQLV